VAWLPPFKCRILSLTNCTAIALRDSAPIDSLSAGSAAKNTVGGRSAGGHIREALAAVQAKNQDIVRLAI
jgi:hypothetical protein